MLGAVPCYAHDAPCTVLTYKTKMNVLSHRETDVRHRHVQYALFLSPPDSFQTPSEYFNVSALRCVMNERNLLLTVARLFSIQM